MMSEESDDDDPQVLKRRRPSWRSDQLNDLIDIIDMRTEARGKAWMKKKRVEGAPLEISAPGEALAWMKRPQPPVPDN